ncbi:MAG: peptidase E [Bacteroidota bacterium]
MKRTLFVYGGQVNLSFVRYAVELSGKENPRVCFLPTASGDNASYIQFFYELCDSLEVAVQPFVQGVWISSYSQEKSFEEILTAMDVIIVGGGNTLNMMAIWQAQAIDKALKKAYEQGAVLAGGSAGSLCWFNGGTTDSRPGELTVVEGLKFMDYSHCPHYHSEESRRPLYHENVKNGVLTAGYACDDLAGIVFKDEKVDHAIALDSFNNSYFLYKEGDQVIEEKLEAQIIN